MENFAPLGTSRHDYADLRDVIAPQWSLARAQAGFWSDVYTRCQGSDGKGYRLIPSIAPNILENVLDANSRDALSASHGDVVTLDSNGQAYWYDSRSFVAGTANPDANTWVGFGSGTIGEVPPNAELDPVGGFTSWDLDEWLVSVDALRMSVSYIMSFIDTLKKSDVQGLDEEISALYEAIEESTKFGSGTFAQLLNSGTQFDLFYVKSGENRGLYANDSDLGWHQIA